MTQTIFIPFDPTCLPTWAQENRAVVARCRTDLAFRAAVCSARTRHIREYLSGGETDRWYIGELIDQLFEP